MKLNHFIAILVLFFVPVTYGTVAAQDAEAISEKAMNAIKIQDMEMVSTINIYDAKGNVRTRQISMASRKFAEYQNDDTLSGSCRC